MVGLSQMLASIVFITKIRTTQRGQPTGVLYCVSQLRCLAPVTSPVYLDPVVVLAFVPNADNSRRLGLFVLGNQTCRHINLPGLFIGTT